MSSKLNICVGDTLKCNKCNHAKIITKEWLQEICTRFFQNRSPMLYATELNRLKCEICGTRKPALLENKLSLPAKFGSGPQKWLPCHQCGGDGGAGGRCPRCGGNGFEPV